MTAATMSRPPVFAVADIDPEKVVADIKRRFPDVPAWFGEFTGSWWAVVDDRMIEAHTPDELHQQISEKRPKPSAGALAEETAAVVPVAPPSWPLPAPRPAASLRMNAAQREPVPRRVDPPPRRVGPSYPPPFPEPGRWRCLIDRCRQLLGLPTGEDG